MKRAMVGILALVFLAAFASPVMAISPYFADWKNPGTGITDCGNVVVTNGGTLIATIDLTNGNCQLTGFTTFNVCRVLTGVSYFVVKISDTNPTDGRISLLEGTQIGVFGFDDAFESLFVQKRTPDTDNCTNTPIYLSGQPR